LGAPPKAWLDAGLNDSGEAPESAHYEGTYAPQAKLRAGKRGVMLYAWPSA
jgi:hypothetical protein